ncbi:MAG: polyribonucleotide nucleotidyltransferase [Oceanicoccus sp.]|jgi:polyribonucleotide nucleotidyltransferase
MSNIIKVSRVIAGQEFALETGRLAHQANGAVTIHHGGTVVLATAVMSEKGDPNAGFFRLTMEYQERFYASGKIKGSRFIKRDGRSSEMGILKARLMDRPVRPLFPKSITNEVQGIATVLSADLINEPGILALNSISAAMMIAGLPFEGPIGAVRIGMIDGELIAFPTVEQTEEGDLDLLVAGTADAITMVEAGSNIVDEETYLKALQMAHDLIKELCELQMELVAKINPEKRTFDLKAVDEAPYEAVKGFLTKADLDTITGVTKKDVKKPYRALEDKVKAQFAAQIEDDTYSEGALMGAVHQLFEINMRENVLEKEVRLDGRKLDQVRQVDCEVGLLPKTHGSALFQRGETQALTIATLGGPGDAQMIDTMDVNTEKKYIHYYNFPPYSVGEARFLRGASRREIGHGALAERALLPVLPDGKEFAYTMLLVSEIVSCNGSSSMASVCGSSLSLMDAGVPIAKPVAGIAMGMVCSKEFKETGAGGYKILTDIQGQEDFAGDMDFKVTGTEDGITALQMDIKVKGITMEILKEALEKAKVGRAYIMERMLVALPTHRPELNENAPMIMNIVIHPDQIRSVIGKGGETIQKITAECGVQIDIDQDGIVIITAPDQESGNKAKEWVEQITYTPNAGDVFDGTVKTIMDFGAFVEFVPGKDGLVHISEMRPFRVNNVTDILKEGDKVKVRLMEVDGKGRYNLTMKEFYDGAMPGAAPKKEAPAPKKEAAPKMEEVKAAPKPEVKKAESVDDIDLDAPFAF